MDQQRQDSDWGLKCMVFMMQRSLLNCFQGPYRTPIFLLSVILRPMSKDSSKRRLRCGRQLLKGALMLPISWYSCPVELPWHVGWLSDLFLINRNTVKGMFFQRSRLWLASCCHSLTGSPHLLTLMETRRNIVRCTMERPTWQGTEDRQPPANSQHKEPRPWVQQPTRNWLPVITWKGLESSPSPVEPWACNTLIAASWKNLRPQLSCAWIPDWWKLWDKAKVF